jgi:hypothetical protein
MEVYGKLKSLKLLSQQVHERRVSCNSERDASFLKENHL